MYVYGRTFLDNFGTEFFHRRHRAEDDIHIIREHEENVWFCRKVKRGKEREHDIDAVERLSRTSTRFKLIFLIVF